MIGILLLNIGTPDNCDVPSVKRYLKEFLDDDNIIDINPIARYMLVNFIICPIRSVFVAKKYKSIWTKDGSPLLAYSNKLKDKMNHYLGDEYKIELGMIVGNPSIKYGLNNLIRKGCKKLVILPMFPQYSTVTTGSCISKTISIMKNYKNIPKQIFFIKNFYSSHNFINSVNFNIKNELKDYKEYYFLFSYHGLPNNNLKKICKNVDICNKNTCIKVKDNFCYKSQCFQTSDLISNSLDIKNYCTTFQSRFGLAPWIKPYTDETVKELRKKGIKNLAIVCPAFTMDCLETIEEIGMEEKEAWKKLGGNKFKLISCVNDSDIWAENLTKIIKFNINQ